MPFQRWKKTLRPPTHKYAELPMLSAAKAIATKTTMNLCFSVFYLSQHATRPTLAPLAVCSPCSSGVPQGPVVRSQISSYQFIAMTSPVVPVKKGLRLKGAGARPSEVCNAQCVEPFIQPLTRCGGFHAATCRRGDGRTAAGHGPPWCLAPSCLVHEPKT